MAQYTAMIQRTACIDRALAGAVNMGYSGGGGASASGVGWISNGRPTLIFLSL